MKTKTALRCLLLTSAAVAASPVLAQDAPPAAPAAASDGEIVVTGQRLANQRSIAAKRADIRVQDTVSADDVGTLPDYGLGEALTRVPGVTLIQNNQRGEAQFTNIRGLNSDYSLIEVDGVPLSTTETTRRNLSLDVLPSAIATSITVAKSLTADLDGNAIGGIVNLKTRSAFDVADHFASVSGQISRYDNRRIRSSSKPSGRAEATVSERFGSDRQFGVVLEGSYFRRDSSSLDSDTDNYLFYGPTGAVSGGSPAALTATPVPDRRRWLTYDNVRERIGFLGKLEYDGDHLKAHVTGGWFQHTNDELRDSNILILSGTPTLTAGGGSVPAASGQVDFDRFQQNRRIRYVDAGVSLLPTDRDRIDLTANYSVGRYRQDTTQNVYTTGGATANLAYTYTLTPGEYTVFTPNNPAYYYNPANYRQTQYGTAIDSVREKTPLFRLNYTHDASDLLDGLTVQAGAQARLARRKFDHGETYYQPVAGKAATLATAISPITTYPYDGAGQNILFVDTDAAASYFANNRASYVLQANNVAQNLTSDYRIREHIYAGYGLLSYAGDRFKANVGLRVENTRLQTGSYGSQAGVYTFQTFDNRYTKLLPSANFAFDVTSTLKLRLNYNKALGRANYDQLAVGRAITTSASGIAIRSGSPNLKPRIADSVNLSADWYFAQDSILSAAVFYKDISDEIVNATTTEIQTIGGLPTTVTTTAPQNVSGSRIRGVELSFVQTRFGFLPGPLSGLGLSLNTTLMNTSPPSILMGDGSYRRLRNLIENSNSAVNAQLLYSLGKFDAYLAYNHTGKLLLFVATDILSNDRTLAPSDTLDFQLRYRFTPNFLMTVSGKNITNDRPQRLVGPNQNLLREELDNGASYWIGAAFKF